MRLPPENEHRLGADNMHPRVLKELADEVAKVFIKLQKAGLSGQVPGDWKEGNITPFFKKERGRSRELQSIESHLCVWEENGKILLEAMLRHT